MKNVFIGKALAVAVAGSLLALSGCNGGGGGDDEDVVTPPEPTPAIEKFFPVIKEAAPNTRWLVGTELNLVNRLAEEVKPQGKIVQFMAPTVCMCSTMQRIDPQHLAWTLENLADGTVVNQIKVPEHEAGLARLALERMLAAS